MNRARDPKTLLAQWVDDQVQLDSRAKYILDRFARFADAECRAWAPVKVLAEVTNSSERTVQYVLRQLQAADLIAPSGDEHTLNPGSKHPRRVPIYQLAVGVAGCDPKASGAEFAPESAPPARVQAVAPEGESLGCKDEPARVQTAAPRNELIGTDTLPSGRDARTREATFTELEQAFPRRGLGFTNRDRAWLAYNAVLEEGYGATRLVEAAVRFAADLPPKLRDLGLDYWLMDRKFRAWFDPPKQGASEPAAVAAVAAFDAPREVVDVLHGRGRDWFRSWLLGASWDEGLRQVRCPRGVQAETINRCFGRSLADIGVTVVHHQRQTEGAAA